MIRNWSIKFFSLEWPLGSSHLSRRIVMFHGARYRFRFCLVTLFLCLLALPAWAHDVTITGNVTFASLDGSSLDHDGLANGTFTVSDGNLIVNGTINCNDDVAASACNMGFNVSGDVIINSGGGL